MTEGEQLKQFIDNQPKSKVSIARDLKITKQTLFQYFKSKLLEEETKKKFEGYFSKAIFTGNTDQFLNGIALPPPANVQQSNAVPQSEVIAMLNAHIQRLESNYDKHVQDLNERAAKEAALFEWIKEMYEEQKNKLLSCLEELRNNMDINSKESEERQIVLMAQIKAASKIAAEREAAGDRKKLAAVLQRLDTYVGEFSK